MKISKRNKKQKIRKLKNRLQTREDLTRKGLDQLLMSFLETLNSKLCSLKSLLKAIKARNKIDILKKYNS